MSSSCAQVFTGGAEHTIVKMPRGCGKGPLARVHSLAVHSGRAPAELAKLEKPAAAPLYQLVFDYDFAAIPADNGPVYMRADVSDMPGYWCVRVSRCQSCRISCAESGADGNRDEIVDSPTDPADNAKRRNIPRRLRRDRSQRVAKRGFFSKLKSWAAKVTKVSQSKTDKRKFELQNSFTIFNQTKDCGGRSKWFPRTRQALNKVQRCRPVCRRRSLRAPVGRARVFGWPKLIILVSFQHPVWLLRGRHARPAQGEPGLCLLQSVAPSPFADMPPDYPQTATSSPEPTSPSAGSQRFSTTRSA